MTHPISIETLRNNAATARAQAKQHENNMNAALGAAQAYEQLLSVLLVAQREDKAKAKTDKEKQGNDAQEPTISKEA